MMRSSSEAFESIVGCASSELLVRGHSIGGDLQNAGGTTFVSEGVRVDGLISARGSIDVHRRRRGLLRSTVTGHIDLAILEVLIRSREAEAAVCPAGFSYFHDWTSVTGYDTDVRVTATRYVLSLSKPYTEVHIVTASRLVNMGVAAATLSVQLAGRPFHAHLSIASFEEEFERQRLGSS